MAVVSRWTGHEARALRLAKRMSLAAFAAHLGISERTLSTWERRGADSVIRKVNQSILDTSLKTSPPEVQDRFKTLAEATPAPEGLDHGTRGAANWTEKDEVLRRTVLIAIATAGGSALAGSELLSPLARDASMTRMDADVDHWQETVWEYGYAYHTTSRESLLADLCADLATLKQQLSVELRVESAAAKPMAAATAQLTALMALICTDLGYKRESRHLWRFARRHAGFSQDHEVQLWVSGHEITSGIYQKRPLRVLADLAEQALAISGAAPSSAGKAELLGGQAQVLSLLTRPRDARIALNMLRGTYEHLPATTTNLRDSIFGWPEHRLRHTESFTGSMIGASADAYLAQDLALKLYPRTRPISRCQVELHRARCLILDGSVSEGLYRASAAIDNVDSSQRKEFVLAIADHVADAVPADYQSQASTLELQDLINAARTGSQQ